MLGALTVAIFGPDLLRNDRVCEGTSRRFDGPPKPFECSAFPGLHCGDQRGGGHTQASGAKEGHPFSIHWGNHCATLFLFVFGVQVGDTSQHGLNFS